MDDRTNTIGLSALLDEVSNDLDEFRKKHPSDYSVKSVTLWWELERERLLTRHSPASAVKKLRRIQGVKRAMTIVFAGWLMMIVVQTAIRLLIG